jgi:hypothetical protein
LTELVGEFLGDVTIPEKQAGCPPLQWEVAICHGFEKQNGVASYMVAIAGGGSAMSQCSQEMIEMQMFMFMR